MGAEASVDHREASSTTARILRVMSISVGASSLLFLVLLLPNLLDAWNRVALWWNVLAILWASGTAGALIAAGLDGRPRRVRVAAGVAALSYLVVTLLAMVAPASPGPPDGVVWIVHDGAIGVTCAAMAFRRRLAVAYLLVCGLVLGVVRWSFSGPGYEYLGVQNGVQSIAFCVIFLIMGISLVQAGRSADRAIAAARTENEAEAQRRARREVGERIHALIHDRVLATLLLAGRATSDADREVAARSAGDAISALERQRDDDRDFTPVQFVWTAQGLVRDLDPEVQFGYEIEEPGEGDQGDQGGGPVGEDGGPGDGHSPGDGRALIPGDVGDTLAAAMLEALRNSLRHADRPGHDTTRAVHIIAGVDRVVVTVLDDGAGFDLERVDSARLGIVSSIRGRMRAIGGVAKLASVVGQGTRVELTWDRALAEARATKIGAGAIRPWHRGDVASPLDLDFWIGPAPGDDAIDDVAPSADGGSATTDASGREARTRSRLSQRIQREPLWFFAVLQIVSNTVLAFTTDPALASTWPSIAALVAYTVALALVVLPRSTPLRIGNAIAVVAITLVVTWLMCLIVPPEPGYFSWHVGSNTLLLLALALRGRIGLAWMGMAGMIVTTGLIDQIGAWGLVLAFVREVGVLLVGSVVSLALRRTINRTLAVERARDARAARESAHAAGAEEQERILRRFECTALPMLREIAAGDAVGAGRRSEWLALEADLRDRIRARALDVEPLRGAVQRARERGVRVVLLDDGGGRAVPVDELARAADWAARLVDGVDDGEEVTLRLRTRGEGHALTVVGADDDMAELVLGGEAAGGTG